MSKDSSEAADAGRGEAKSLLTGEAVGAGKLTLEMEFAACVKEMHDWAWRRDGSYINHEEAAPFVLALPEFWREPARVMACVGYYASADEWMAKHVEDGA